MTAPNPLVAPRQDSTTAISGIGIAESAVDVYNGIADGSWLEGGLGLAGAGLETLGLVIDPVGTLVSYGVAWLMEHVKPLSDALDWLAGDPDTIASYAQTWRNVSQVVGQARTDFDGSVRTDTAAWTGDAGDAYRAHAARQSEQFSAASTAADTVGTVVEIVGVLVGVVREIVRDLVADCVATLIARIPQWLAEIAGTLGIATPHVVASAVALISKWVSRIADVIRKLVRSIEKLRPLLRKLDEIWAAVRSGVRGLRGAVPGSPNAPDTPSFAPDHIRNPASVDTPTVSTSTPGTTPGGTPRPARCRARRPCRRTRRTSRRARRARRPARWPTPRRSHRPRRPARRRRAPRPAPSSTLRPHRPVRRPPAQARHPTAPAPP